MYKGLDVLVHLIYDTLDQQMEARFAEHVCSTAHTVRKCAHAQIRQQNCMEGSCESDLHLTHSTYHCDCKQRAWIKVGLDTLLSMDQQSLLATRCNCMYRLALLS